MPHLPRDEAEKSLADYLEPLIQNLTITTVPVVVTGVNRKVNIGNFETIDVFGAVAIPINTTIDEKLTETINALMTFGYASTSKQVSERYNFIKNAVHPSSDGSGEPSTQ